MASARACASQLLRPRSMWLAAPKSFPLPRVLGGARRFQHDKPPAGAKAEADGAGADAGADSGFRPQRKQYEYKSEKRRALITCVIGSVFIGAIIYDGISYHYFRPKERLDSSTPAERAQLCMREAGTSGAATTNAHTTTLITAAELGELGAADDATAPMRERMQRLIAREQSRIVDALEETERTHGDGDGDGDGDGAARFCIDRWSRPQGGGGVSCVLRDGAVFERAGVNTSVVHGTLPPAAVARMRVHHRKLRPAADTNTNTLTANTTTTPDSASTSAGLPFFAAGLSLVLHPRNPYAPAVHLNYRYFETAGGAWWFGGGTDLTPAYLFDADAVHFHGTVRAVCDAHDRAYYPRFKRWCDRYFRNTHRREARGVGGIFFDDLDGDCGVGDGGGGGGGSGGSNSGEQGNNNNGDGSIAATPKSADQLFAFVSDALAAFLPSYAPILARRIAMPYGAPERRWQLLRRGRYVEFNLVHDRGTSFGLATPGARVESILMSLPPLAAWEYMNEPAPGSPEAHLVDVLQTPREWA